MTEHHDKILPPITQNLHEKQKQEQYQQLHETYTKNGTIPRKTTNKLYRQGHASISINGLIRAMNIYY
jgi:hypothetical protein